MKYIAKSSIQWVSFLGLLLATHGYAQIVHISHCMAGCPVDVSSMTEDSSELVVRQLFVASIDGETGLADWQAYRVLAGSVGVASLLPRLWFEDSLVGGSTGFAEVLEDEPQFVQSVSADAEERNYQLSEIELLSEDQGRVVPMTSFAGTPYWTELNFLSNMAPLPFDLRVGSWARLDQAINELARRIGEVYVVSGPIPGPRSEDDSEGLDAPPAYFKVVSTPDAVTAFVFRSDVKQHINFCDQISSLPAVEADTGLRLYSQRPGSFAATLDEQLGCAR